MTFEEWWEQYPTVSTVIAADIDHEGETMNLLKKFFPKAVELEKANKRIEELEASVGDLTIKNHHLWESYNGLQAQYHEAVKLLDEFKEKLREQNDADLLLVSARITQSIIAGKKPAVSDVSEQQRLIAQRQALGNAQYYSSSSYGNLLGQLGLSGVFGQSS